MSDRHYSDHHDHLPDPPAPPQLMKLEVLEGGVVMFVFRDVKEWASAPPHTFKFETLDGQVRLFDMPGRDFVLRPQASDG